MKVMLLDSRSRQKKNMVMGVCAQGRESCLASLVSIFLDIKIRVHCLGLMLPNQIGLC